MADKISGVENVWNLESVISGFETGSITYYLHLETLLCQMEFILLFSKILNKIILP